ncbi:MAG: hypothetical protein GY750_19310 [Lentisphaerae bacterium]|nr:hypothetical protein [Lentisphaerota bacterium]MCP4103547.1 hypothetical protein [Lentisphaerota bacterium]
MKMMTMNKPMTKIKKYFNMIEITLATGIVAVGMTSILSLFPVGLNVARNSIVEGLSASAVDQFITYVKFHCKNKTSYESLFGDGVGTTGSLKTTIDRKTDPAVKAAIKTNSDNFVTEFSNNHNSMPSFKRVKGLNIYNNNGVEGSLGKVFFAVQGGENANKLDYSAMILAWKQPVDNYNWDVATSAYVQDTDSNYLKSAGLCIEVSWPAIVDYADREKRYYYVEIKKPE